MKPTFHAEIVNKPFEDPVLFVRTIHCKNAMLFDLGNLDALEQGKLNAVSDIFVTHMHIDHFIGFDTMLRTLLKKDTPMSIYGPTGIIDCVEGKLKGYTWNLIKEYPLRLEVFEIQDVRLNRASFYACNEFVRINRPSRTFANPVKRDAAFSVNALVLSHKVPVIAYCVEEDVHININKALLDARQLPVGPWLGELKNAIRTKAQGDYIIQVGEKGYPLSDLADLVMLTKGHKLCYVMDISPNADNIDKLIPFIEGADSLYCEAFFSHTEYERAEQRHHLTAQWAGIVARRAGVRRMTVMHFSQKYKSEPELLYREAEEAFLGVD